MNKWLLCILMIIATGIPVAAFAAWETTVLSDQINWTQIDENGWTLIDTLAPLTSDVRILTRRGSFYYSIPFAPPGHEADVCDPAVLAEKRLNSATPFLFSDGPEWLVPFYVVSGKPWATKLELINYGGGNVDYNGFTFRVEFVATTATPLPINLNTTVTETITNGVSSYTWVDLPWYDMQPLPFGIPAGTQWPLPDNWKVDYDSYALCKIEHPDWYCIGSALGTGWPYNITGDETNGTRQYYMNRTGLYDIAPYYNSLIPMPTATVVATDGYLDIAIPAARTAEMANWAGSLRITQLRPSAGIAYYPPVITEWAESTFNELPMIVTP